MAVIWLAMTVLVVGLGLLALWYLRSVGKLRRKSPAPALLAEIDAMNTAARLQAMTNAAADHMDVFIRERHRQKEVPPQWPTEEGTNERGRSW